MCIKNMLYGLFSIRVWKSKKAQHHLKESQVKDACEDTKRELNMAVVLIWLVINFISCQSIKIIPDIYEALYCSHQEVRTILMLSYPKIIHI